jgi:hypothetical protein
MLAEYPDILKFISSEPRNKTVVARYEYYMTKYLRNGDVTRSAVNVQLKWLY